LYGVYVEIYLADLILLAVEDTYVCTDVSVDVPTFKVIVVFVVAATTTGFLYAGCCLSPSIEPVRADTNV